MSVANPAHQIARRSVVGAENEWCKMFDPPTASPPTPELLAPTNPVPGLLPSLVPGASNIVPNTVRRDLLHENQIPMWDGRLLPFFMFSDPDIPVTVNGTWPGPTIRVPRGVVFHGETATHGGPHTIHWHGIEPTPINDGVGHCSMELGNYTYQWQPNFIGTYFYHCHRNTMQHFEYGLYGMLLIEPPDAYNAAYDGKNIGGYPRRIAANVTDYPKFTGFNKNPLTAPDPQGVFPTDPHAMTVPYDYEALWVLDDVDSNWRTFMPGHADTFPNTIPIVVPQTPPAPPLTFAAGLIPGVNDQFNKGDFHDFNPDYFFCTGVPFPATVGNTVTLANPADTFGSATVPAAMNSGVAGMQVAIDAEVNKTILVRCLNASYVNIKVSFPMNVLITAFDGRALGVPPFGKYNKPILLPANTPFELSTARRFDALIRVAQPVNSFGTVQYIHNRTGQTLMTGRIPIVIS